MPDCTLPGRPTILDHSHAPSPTLKFAFRQVPTLRDSPLSVGF